MDNIARMLKAHIDAHPFDGGHHYPRRYFREEGDAIRIFQSANPGENKDNNKETGP